MVVMSVGAMVVVVSADVHVIGAARQTAQQQPDAETSDEQPAAEAKERLHALGGDARENQRQKRREDNDDAGMRDGRDEAEQEGVADGPALADQVRGDKRLSVARRQRVGRTKRAGEQE